jgi:hypothetical protein
VQNSVSHLLRDKNAWWLKTRRPKFYRSTISVRQKISYAKVVKVTPVEESSLVLKEAKIVGFIRKRWEESLDSLTLEQLEQTSVALPATLKLGNREITNVLSF